MKLQVNVKIPDEELAMLKALAKGELASDCPTCGKPWDLSNLATKDPIPCLLYTSPSPRDRQKSRMPSSA